jgi:hypothetical protein
MKRIDVLAVLTIGLMRAAFTQQLYESVVDRGRARDNYTSTGGLSFTF